MIRKTAGGMAYLAGLIDGEGSIGLYKKKDKSTSSGFAWLPVLKITNTDKRLVEWARDFLKLYCKANLNLEHTKRSHGRSFSWRVLTSSNGLRIMLPKLLPYLKSKKEEAEAMLRALKLLRENLCLKDSEKRAENTKKIEKLALEIRELKTKKMVKIEDRSQRLIL